MTKTDSTANLFSALVKAQHNIGGAVKGTANPFFKSKFAGLGEVIAVCKSALLEQGIGVAQMPCVLDSGAPGLETVLYHTSGECMSGVIPVICSKQNDPQAMGSAYTYARRYALQSALLIPSVDDDGEAAMYRNQGGDASALPTTSQHEQMYDWMEQAGISREDFTMFLRGQALLGPTAQLAQLNEKEVRDLLEDWSKIEGKFIKWKAALKK